MSRAGGGVVPVVPVNLVISVGPADRRHVEHRDPDDRGIGFDLDTSRTCGDKDPEYGRTFCLDHLNGQTSETSDPPLPKN